MSERNGFGFPFPLVDDPEQVACERQFARLKGMPAGAVLDLAGELRDELELLLFELAEVLAREKIKHG